MSTYVFAQTVGLTGVVPTYEAADAAGNTFEPGDRVFLHVKNDQPASTAASVTVTVIDPNTIAPRASTSFDPNLTIVVAPESSEMRGPITATRFANPTSGYAELEYDDVTETSLAVFNLNPPGM